MEMCASHHCLTECDRLFRPFTAKPCMHILQRAGACCPQESDLPVKAYRAFDLSLPTFELPQLPSVQLPLPLPSAKVEVEVPPVQVR